MERFRRKNIRLPASSYLGHQWYFLTMCTEGRAIRFDDRFLVERLLGLLAKVCGTQDFVVPAYCFMPDHLHLLVTGTNDSSDMLRFSKDFKQRSAYSYKQQTGARLWQKKSYDHILRKDESWQCVVWYIWMNPVRKDLCQRPEDWPYSGSFTMDWRKLLSPPQQLWVPPWKEREA